jgi:hypothetical protein
VTVSLLRSLVPLLSLTLACGCGGNDAACPSVPPGMASLAAQAASIDFTIYDAASASCDGNDVSGGAPTPVSERHVGGGGETTLQLPPGRYVVVLHAYDADGGLIGSGCSLELFTPGQRACLDVTLSPPSSGGRGANDLGLPGDGGFVVPPSGDMAGVVAFSPQTSGTTNNLFQVWYAGNNELFVAGAGGTILHTTNGGASWQSQKSNTTQDLEAVWGSGPNDVYVVGTAATVLHSTNGGATWSKLSVSVSVGNGLWDVWGSGANDVYIVGDKGTVLHGNAASFTPVNVGVSSYINDVWGSSASDVYLFGGGGLIMHGSASGGFTKQPSGSTTDVILYGWGSADGSDVWVNSQNSAGTVNNILHSGNHGASWTNQLSGAISIGAMWSTASGHGFATGAQILDTTDHGAHWNPAGVTPQPLFGIGGDSTGAMGVWTVGASGTILHRP